MLESGDSECAQCRTEISECGTVPESDSKVGHCRIVINEWGLVLDSTSEHSIYSMVTIINYNLSDMTMTNYGKFLILLMQVLFLKYYFINLLKI